MLSAPSLCTFQSSKNEGCVFLRCAKFPSLIINAGLQVLYFPMYSLKLKRIAVPNCQVNPADRLRVAWISQQHSNQPPETGSRLKWTDETYVYHWGSSFHINFKLIVKNPQKKENCWLNSTIFRNICKLTWQI